MILVVGAGLAGLTVARYLAEHDRQVMLVESSSHIGGLCREASPGVPLFGPHTFHTTNLAVLDWVTKLMPWDRTTYRVKAEDGAELPIGPDTLIELLGVHDFLRLRSLMYSENHLSAPLRAFEASDAPLAQEVARTLYERYFAGYSAKQWGAHWQHPEMRSVLNRVPIFLNHQPTYHGVDLQFVPAGGYDEWFARLVDHPNISLECNGFVDVTPRAAAEYDEVIWTGALDQFHRYSEGALPYRTMRWDTLTGPNFQHTDQVNFNTTSVEYTRMMNYSVNGPNSQTLETPTETRPGDTPHYPIPAGPAQQLARKYRGMRRPNNVHLCGRLATYRYMDMDDVVASALALGANLVAR